ncbi:hypothetical protein RJ640_001788 [Escallonia rubra]|uniref:G-patch domain-containing protein n=1 Tax=Escallonia rubra TaxID=112253 RepID=A0AA88UGV5_9ASTE|nr:hypothetical protein RJ640_001788 [Escallonia rubra]
MAEQEARLLEEQLQHQLQEQKDSLAAVNHALASDPSNFELLSVGSLLNPNFPLFSFLSIIREELVQAIKDAEESLLHLKRARLLQVADLVLQRSNCTAEAVRREPLDPTYCKAEGLEDHCYSVGSKCRFRHTDGRWYDGLIVGLEGPNAAKIAFLTPTSESMLEEGDGMRSTDVGEGENSEECASSFFSNDVDLVLTAAYRMVWIDAPLSSLKKYIPTLWDASLVGSSIWAVSDTKAGIWRKAELELWDDQVEMGQVVFRHDGSSSKLGTGDISLSKYAQISDEEEKDSSSGQSECSDYEEDSSEGSGLLESSSLLRGIQTETAVFAKWENHTRGIASKMMASMGYREGMGLGASGQGMLNPISVKVLPRKQSLDHALDSRENYEKENQKKKQSRGGKRKRDKKFAAAARAAKEDEKSSPDVFSLINTQLTMQGEASTNGSAKKQWEKASVKGKKEDRWALVAYDDEMKDLRMRIEKLEEMVNRNKKEKVVCDAAMRKLNETRKALAEAEAAHASASDAVVSKEREKRWLKF